MDPPYSLGTRPLLVTHQGPPTPSLERITHHVPPPLLGKDDSSRSPHPILKRVTHHDSPPLSSPSPRKGIMDDSPLPPLPSSWCRLQTGPHPLAPQGVLFPQKNMTHHCFPPPKKRITHHCHLSPPLGACYRLVRPLPLGPQGVPLCQKRITHH